MSKAYGLMGPGHKIFAVSERRLCYLIESGEFSPYNYVFDYDARSWIRPSDDPLLLPVEYLSKWIESPFEKPQFSPPPFVPEVNDEVPQSPEAIDLYRPMDNKDSDQLNLEVKLLEQENADAMERLIEKENRIVELMTQVSVLESRVKGIDYDRYEEEIEHLKNENESLRRERLILQKEGNFYKAKLIEKSKALRTLKIKAKKLLERNEHLGESFEAAINTGLLVQKELENLKGDITKLKEVKVSEPPKAQVKVKKEEVVKKPIPAPAKPVVIEKKVEEESVVLSIEESPTKKPPVKAPNFDRMQETLNTKSEEELKSLMGEYFSLDNSPIWMVIYDGVEKGPFRFEDVKSMLKFERINTQTKLKKKSELAWLPLKDHFEFSAPVEEIDVTKNGEVVRHFLIKRSEYRAPFYEVAELMVGNVSIKGFCVSLSVSGCFIEMPRLNESLLKIGADADVIIKAISLDHEIKSKVVVRRVSNKRPRGIGLSFEFLDPESKSIIENFINQYLAKHNIIAA